MSVRWSEDEFALYMQHRGIHRAQTQPVSEKAFVQAVITMARKRGFLAYHTYRSTKSAEGFPDLILAPGPTIIEAGHPLYAIECKTDVGQVTPAQQAWLTALQGCTGVVAEVWRPQDLEDIIERLRG